MSDRKRLRIDDLTDDELKVLLASEDHGASLHEFAERDADGEMSVSMARYLTAQQDALADEDPHGYQKWKADSLAAFPEEEDDL